MEPLGYRSTALHSAERREDEGFKEGLRIMGSIKNRRSGSEAMGGRVTRRGPAYGVFADRSHR